MELGLPVAFPKKFSNFSRVMRKGLEIFTDYIGTTDLLPGIAFAENKSIITEHRL